MSSSTKVKVCVITCYKDPDYVRGEVISRAIDMAPKLQLVRIKNKHRGLFRYPEVLIKLFLTRIRHRPDIYLLTFRGYELLIPVRLLTIGKKFIFDEFINLIEWLVYEHKKLNINSLLHKSLLVFYRFMLLSANTILTDTKAHAAYSAKLMNISPEKYLVVPVGADEDIFKFSAMAVKTRPEFNVFYYGNMLPLHGLKFVCDSAVEVAKNDPSISFTIIGGKSETKALVDKSVRNGAKIEYRPWVDYKELPEYIAKSSLCLGGPFGNTVQAQMVVTGKTYQFLAVSKPVVIGKTKIKEDFEDKKNCILVEQANAHAITQAIFWAKNNPDELQKIAKSGHKLFQDKYSEKNISRILAGIV